MKRMARALAAALFCSLVVAAQAPAPDIPGKPGGEVTALPVPRVTVAAGKPARVELQFRVAPGYHINSNLPRSELLIATVLKLAPPTDVGVGKVTYPKGEDIRLPLAPEEKVNVYTGDFAISALVSAARTATPGRYKVHGELKYQACNDRACFPPRKVAVEFEVTVLKSRIPPDRASRPSGHNPPQSPHIYQ